MGLAVWGTCKSICRDAGEVRGPNRIYTTSSVTCTIRKVVTISRIIMHIKVLKIVVCMYMQAQGCVIHHRSIQNDRIYQILIADPGVTPATYRGQRIPYRLCSRPRKRPVIHTMPRTEPSYPVL
jgi:hypothetical protein